MGMEWLPEVGGIVYDLDVELRGIAGFYDRMHTGYIHGILRLFSTAIAITKERKPNSLQIRPFQFK